jgi:hypothetical protein
MVKFNFHEEKKLNKFFMKKLLKMTKNNHFLQKN